MREIKFRGQRQSDNKWIYGDLLQPIEICDIYEISDCESIDGSRYDVVEDTIGQYTGLKDNNGKEIYEGDIVKANWFDKTEVIGEIYFSMGCFILANSSVSDNQLFIFKNLEVIGNVWEDSDLLNDSKNTKSN